MHQIFWHNQDTYKRSFVNQVLIDTGAYHKCPQMEGSPDDDLTYDEIKAHTDAHDIQSEQLKPDVAAGPGAHEESFR